MKAVKAGLEELTVLTEIISGVKEEETSNLVEEIMKANRVFIGGAGRSLLSMKGFAMRLMHVKHITYLVGEVCTPSVQPGDLLIVASGRGTTKVTLDLVRKAKSHGARTAVLTMHPDAPIPQTCDLVLTIPETPAVKVQDSEELSFAKVNLPGNFPELAISVVLDGVIAELMGCENTDGAVLNFMHANLE